MTIYTFIHWHYHSDKRKYFKYFGNIIRFSTVKVLQSLTLLHHYAEMHILSCWKKWKRGTNIIGMIWWTSLGRARGVIAKTLTTKPAEEQASSMILTSSSNLPNLNHFDFLTTIKMLIQKISSKSIKNANKFIIRVLVNLSQIN